MSRLGIVAKLIVFALAAAVVSALGSASAGAVTAPALKVCKKAPVGLGVYTDSTCTTTGSPDEWAWSWPGARGTQTVYCLKEAGAFTESLCETGPSGGFRAKIQGEPFPPLLGTGGLSVLLGSILSAATIVHCASSRFAGQPETEKLIGKLILSYTGCTVPKPASNCKVNSVGAATGTIITNSLLGHSETLRLITFVPESGKTFVTLQFTGPPGECGIQGQSAKVEGSEMCAFASDIANAAIDHTLTCLESEGALTLGGVAANFEGSSKLLVEGNNLLWKIR